MIRMRGSVCSSDGGMPRPGMGRGPLSAPRGAPRARSRKLPRSRDSMSFPSTPPTLPARGWRGSTSCVKLAKAGAPREMTMMKSLTAAASLVLVLLTGCQPSTPPQPEPTPSPTPIGVGDGFDCDHPPALSGMVAVKEPIATSLILENASRDKLAGVGAGSPNLLLYARQP